MGSNSGDIMQRAFCKTGDSYKPADIGLMEVDCACPINLDYFSVDWSNIHHRDSERSSEIHKGVAHTGQRSGKEGRTPLPQPQGRRTLESGAVPHPLPLRPDPLELQRAGRFRTGPFLALETDRGPPSCSDPSPEEPTAPRSLKLALS